MSADYESDAHRRLRALFERVEAHDVAGDLRKQIRRYIDEANRGRAMTAHADAARNQRDDRTLPERHDNTDAFVAEHLEIPSL